MKFNTAIEFMITNYDELSAAVDVNQEIGFENIGGLRITVYSDSLENSLRTFVCSKNLSSSIQMISDKKPESKSDELVRNFDAYLLLYAPAIPNVKKACEFITKLSVKWKDLASIAIKEPGDRRNVLMQAIYYGKAKIVKLLMGIDPKLYETEDRLGNNPLLLASIYGRIDIVNYFLNNCKKSHLVKSKSDQLNPLFCAIYGGKEDAVKFWLYNYPILYNDVSRLGDTPIAIARRYNRIEIAKYLESCVTTPSLPLEKVCDSSYSWLDCNETYFSTNNDSFRNYCVAIVKDKWGRNAAHILMSSIAIILSSPQLIFDEKSPAYRNAIERAANQWNKLKLFIEYKIKADEVDDENNHPVVAFLLALSKQQAETTFGWDVKLQQDKGAPYRQQLKTYLQLFLQYVQIDPEAIKKQYELQKWKGQDLLILLTKWYPELGEILPNVAALFQKKQGLLVRRELEVVEPKKVAVCDLYLKGSIVVSGLENLWSLLEYPINILFGANGSGKTLLLTSLESYIPKLSKSAISQNIDPGIVQKILNKDNIKNAEVLLLDEPDTHLDPINAKRLIDNLRQHYKGIKIIMVTHQIGTILLFPGNIFYVRRTEPAHITVSACHPMLARLRMTKGLRDLKEIGHIQIDVFVESQEDVNFYQKIYQLLHQSRYQSDNTWISDRYRPNFLCISLGGGHSTQAAVKAIAIRNSLDERQLITQPFAILDDDGRGGHIPENALSGQEIDSSKLIFTKRYSLENYLYDPFVICSVMPLDKLRMIGNQSIRLCLIRCKEVIDTYFQGSANAQDDIADLTRRIHEYIKEYFNIICNYQLDKSQKPLQSSQQMRETLITFFYVGKATKFECMYPEAFLNMRGHDIEKVFNTIVLTEQGLNQVRNDAKAFKPILLTYIKSNDSICLPSDLIDVFKELNKKMKLQINKFIKPTKYQEMIIEERAREGKSSEHYI